MELNKLKLPTDSLFYNSLCDIATRVSVILLKGVDDTLKHHVLSEFILHFKSAPQPH